MTIEVLGIDIAKNTFQLHGADDAGTAVLKKRLPRNRLSPYVANLHPCTIVMESCGGANYWAGLFQRCGHTVKLISCPGPANVCARRSRHSSRNIL